MIFAGKRGQNTKSERRLDAENARHGKNVRRFRFKGACRGTTMPFASRWPDGGGLSVEESVERVAMDGGTNSASKP